MKYAIAFLAIGLWAAIGVPQAQYGQARAAYYEGADGSTEASARADKMFADLYNQHPEDSRIKAYYGSLRLLEASRTWALWKKYSLSKEGIQLMDSAVRADSSDLDVRFVRAVTEYSLPPFFHRRDQSRQEFEFLAAHAAEAASTGKLEPRLAAASAYYHGEFLRESSDSKQAKEAWKEAIAIAPQSRAARDSANELKKLTR